MIAKISSGVRGQGMGKGKKGFSPSFPKFPVEARSIFLVASGNI